jgi:hypothetical protein
MGGTGIFNRLALELSLVERKDLLEKIKSQMSLSQDPLYKAQDDDAFLELDQEFAQLPWYQHIWLVILSFFSAKPPLTLYQDREVTRLSRMLDAMAPGLYDYARGLLLPDFYDAFNRLKEGSRFFYTALDASVSQDRGAFFVFLGSLEMEHIHTRLLAETDPQKLTAQFPGSADAELRQIALHRMDEIMGTIAEAERLSMYANARSLNCLKQLSSFLFDRVSMAFSLDSSVSGMTCPAATVKELLKSLNNILFSMKGVPPLALLESLFVFLLQENRGEGGYDVDQDITKLLSRAEGSLAAIREFNQRVPLTLLVRCIARDVNLNPQPISGGEDWFVVYREHWRLHIETRVNEYAQNRRRKNIDEAMGFFFNGIPVSPLAHAESVTNPGGIPLRGAQSLAFLQAFATSALMADMNKILGPIFINGDFHRPENQVDFAEYYNELITLGNAIQRLDESLSPVGDMGKRYDQAKGEMSAVPVKRRKVQLVLEEAAGESAGIIEGVKTAITGMILILNGILKKDPTGKYGLLENLSVLAGKGTEFLDGLVDTVNKFQRVLYILEDISVLEPEK